MTTLIASQKPNQPIYKQANIRQDLLTRKHYLKKDLNRIVYVKKDHRLYLDNEGKIRGRSFYFSKDLNKIQIIFNKQVLQKKLKQKNAFVENDYEQIKSLLLRGEG